MTTKNKLVSSVLNAKIWLFAFLFAFITVSCDDDDDSGSTPQNIVEVASTNSDLEELVTALGRFPDLVTALSTSGTYTVFAPTDAAFAALYTTLGVNNSEDISDAVLREVLEYHVLTTASLSASELQTQSYTTLQGESVSIVVGSGVVINGTTDVTTADVQASNGVVHVINEVLIPQAALDLLSEPTQDIVELAQATPSLSILVEALLIYPDLVEALSSETDEYTVFAPTNDAFESFLETIGQTDLNDIPEDVLRNVLEYHVASGTVTSELLASGEVATLSEENVTVVVGSTITVEGATVTGADVLATNGVVHIINAVMVNPSIVPIVNTIVEPAYFNKDFTTLVAAVVQADLLETLIDPNATFTLFAPNNDAFEAAGITELPADDAEGNALLTSILTYHVLETEIAAADLPVTVGNSPAAIESLGGEFYLTNSGSGVFINGTTEVIATDILADNGITHVIDRTLVPATSTIAEIVIASSEASTPEFTQLLAALSLPGASGLLAAASADASTLTVFAPTDAAFEALYVAYEVADLEALVAALGEAAVVEVLEHHIVGSRVFSTDLVSGPVATLNQNVTIDVSNLTVADASGTNTATLQPALLNVLATNGVVHAIDEVLLPEL